MKFGRKGKERKGNRIVGEKTRKMEWKEKVAGGRRRGQERRGGSGRQKERQKERRKKERKGKERKGIRIPSFVPQTVCVTAAKVQ